ncbi:hypothetical protein ABW19_dt0210511 [Dactylella cylindrospora]|nr:hypothetical protein ABW19_dt0210511 [Dactylella cylindrospora]
MRPARDSTAILSLALLLSFNFSLAIAQTSRPTSTSTSPPRTIALSTVPAIPTTFSVPTACFSPSPATANDNQLIYNVGCGISQRQNCCPPEFKDGVIFDGNPELEGGESGCPNGYTGKPTWWFTGSVRLETSGVSTVVCCPRSVNLWSTFTGIGALCFTQTQYTSEKSGLNSQYWVTTYARPLFLAAAQVTPTSSSERTSSTSESRSSSQSSEEVTESGVESTSSGEPTGTSTAIGGQQSDEAGEGQETGGGNGGGLSSGAKAGIAIGVIVPLIAGGIIGCIFYRRRKLLSTTNRDLDLPIPPAPSSSEFYPLRSSSGMLESEIYSRFGESQMHVPSSSGEMMGDSHGAGMIGMETYAQQPAFENAEKLPAQNEERRLGGHFS